MLSVTCLECSAAAERSGRSHLRTSSYLRTKGDVGSQAADSRVEWGEVHGVRAVIDADILREGERNLNNAGFVVNLEL